MPMIQCDIREGRTRAQKRALAREITRVVQKTIGFHHIKAGKHLPDFVPARKRARRVKRRG